MGISTMTSGKSRRTSLIAIAIGCVVAIALYLLKEQFSSPRRPVVAATRPVQPASGPSAHGPRCVSAFISAKFTADGIDGYRCQMTDELQQRGLDVYPLVEPGTESEPRIVKLIGVYFLGKHSIDVTNSDALSKLDVIVAPRIWMLRDDARQAIESAVEKGTGLLIRDGLGCFDPGTGPDVSRLSGFTDSSFAYNPHPMECEVIGEHPILGKLSGKIGTVLKITPNGTIGLPGVNFTPLIRSERTWTRSASLISAAAMIGLSIPCTSRSFGRKAKSLASQIPLWERLPKDLQSACRYRN